MSVQETASGWHVDRRDAYNQRIRRTFASEGAARAFDARMEADVHKQRTAMQGLRHSPDMKLGEAINEYLDARVISQGTRQRETQALNTFLRGIGNKRLADLTPRALAEYIERRKLLLAPWTSYRETLWLRSRFQWFAEQWYIPANPVAPLPKPTAPRISRARALSFPESAELFRSLPPRLALRAMIAHDAGATSAEAHMLRVRHIDFAQHAIEMQPAKHHAFRLVPMTARLENALGALLVGTKNPDALLFHHQGKPICEATRSHLSTMLNMRVTFQMRYHDLRHTFATRLAAVAQRPRIVQYLMGHHPRTPTEKYDHPTLEDCRAAIAAARQKGEQTP